MKAPLRSSTSAHHAPRPGSRGRTTRRKAQSSDAQSDGSRVREASMQATPCPRDRAAPTRLRTTVAVPAPSDPMSSVRRPRGRPPPSASSSAARPVGSASAATGGGAMTCSSWERSWASCIQAIGIEGFTLTWKNRINTEDGLRYAEREEGARGTNTKGRRCSAGPDLKRQHCPTRRPPSPDRPSTAYPRNSPSAPRDARSSAPGPSGPPRRSGCGRSIHRAP